RAVLDGRASVRSDSGEDLTAAFSAAAEIVCELAARCGAGRAYLKENSPSCGVGRVEIDGKASSGMGVTAAMLADRGVEVIGVE
ncbi:MAG: DUF523 domain-containing protein, partial [Planctomycetia bacterium]|nr:DUF523 domain-containing protein [Planctomycetia bacterium]